MHNYKDALLVLEAAFEECWGRDTSSDPEKWSVGNPAWGQCAVTALIVDDFMKKFSGLESRIVWTRVRMPWGEVTSHYFNEINGEQIDLTRCQMLEGVIVPPGGERLPGKDTREHILSYPETVKRYELLKKRVLLRYESLRNYPKSSVL